MRVLGNFIWIIMGGFISALGYFILTVVCYITIIGIPLGKQFAKLAQLELSPFGKAVKKIETKNSITRLLINLVWMITIGFFIAIIHLAFGIFFCITIIGIPFGIQHFKLAQVSFFPFGKQIEYVK